jgi:hypothetical protein
MHPFDVDWHICVDSFMFDSNNLISIVQKELIAAINISHQLYYADVVDPILKDLDQLETLSNKARMW